jgi:hypothetical protein
MAMAYPNSSIFRWFAASLISVLVSGCLSSITPAFDESNSVAARHSPELGAIFAAMGKDLAADAAISVEDRVAVLDGMVVLQNWNPLTRDYSYVGYALFAGRPAICTPASRDDSSVMVVAQAHGVQATVVSDSSRLTDLPKIAAAGEPPAMTAFIRDLFRDQSLACVVAAVPDVAKTG